jgi:hypothetical protein
MKKKKRNWVIPNLVNAVTTDDWYALARTEQQLVAPLRETNVVR